jgi:hypothetical protein
LCFSFLKLFLVHVLGTLPAGGNNVVMLRQSHELTSQLLHVIVVGINQRPVVSDPVNAKPVGIRMSTQMMRE